MRKLGSVVTVGLLLAACNSPATQSAAPTVDCRTASAACAAGFECAQAAPGDAWECKKPEAPKKTSVTKGAPPMAPSTPAPPVAATKVIKLTEAEVDSLVKPRLQVGEALAHAVFKGPLGPSPSAIFAVARKDGGFVAFVLRSDTPDSARIDLPSFCDWNNVTGEVVAVMLDDIDGDSVKEPIVMTTFMTGMGSEGAVERRMNAVFDWNGTSFVRRADLESKIGTSDTARGIRKLLGY